MIEQIFSCSYYKDQRHIPVQIQGKENETKCIFSQVTNAHKKIITAFVYF